MIPKPVLYFPVTTYVTVVSLEARCVIPKLTLPYCDRTTLVSVQSSQRGAAYASVWTLKPAEGSGDAPAFTVQRACSKRVSQHPCSSMAVLGDVTAFGDVEGSVVIKSTKDLKHRASSREKLTAPCTQRERERESP